jgi:hypothetical protein
MKGMILDGFKLLLLYRRGPDHPSLWLFCSSEAPHVIETVPLENRRQVGTVDS